MAFIAHPVEHPSSLRPMEHDEFLKKLTSLQHSLQELKETIVKRRAKSKREIPHSPLSSPSSIECSENDCEIDRLVSKIDSALLSSNSTPQSNNKPSHDAMRRSACEKVHLPSNLTVINEMSVDSKAYMKKYNLLK